MFLRFGSDELNNHSIHFDWHLASDYALLTITISIIKEHIQTKKCTIVKNSEKEKIFINKVIKAIKDINTSDLSDIVSLKNIVCSFICSLERIWEKNSKIINITEHSKSWWNVNCSRDLEKYRLSKHIENWKQFKKWSSVLNVPSLTLRFRKSLTRNRVHGNS